ncbi:zinc ribbon domain-containing protein [Candidatus Thorarchaeota archaeon]|nr:MAG: zinc ribbon domain-containing protein [Candidatus Thorarchaeota archaeon]
MQSQDYDDDNNWGLLIPIGVLFIVFLVTGNGWLFIPIFVLVCVLVSDRTEEKKIRRTRRDVDHWRAPDADTYTSGAALEKPSRVDKPIYDRKKQKEEGVTCGTFIPIVILGWLYWVSRSWVFLIPLLILVVSLISTLYRNTKGRSEVAQELRTGSGRTVSDIADSAGVPQEKAREHIVREKRRGSSDVWFDPSTGGTIPTPVQIPDSVKEGAGSCVYCGFSLKPEDRFCPYCGAPIKASE